MERAGSHRFRPLARSPTDCSQAMEDSALLGLVFDRRLVKPGTAVCGAGIFELDSGEIAVSALCPKTSDLADIISEVLRSLVAAGCEVGLPEVPSREEMARQLSVRLLPPSPRIQRQLSNQLPPGNPVPTEYLAIGFRSKLEILMASAIPPSRLASPSVAGLSLAPLGIPRGHSFRAPSSERVSTLKASPIQQAGGPTTRSGLGIPRSIAVYRKTATCKLRFGAHLQAKLRRPPRRKFDSKQVGRSRAVHRTLFVGARIHRKNFGNPSVGANQNEIQGKAGVFHPERRFR